MCAAARPGDEPAAALTTWPRRLFDFLPGKRLIVSELLELTGRDNPLVHSSRARALAAGRPLLTAAQKAKEIRADLTIEQIFDMIVAIAKIPGDAGHVDPMLRTMLDGLRLSPDERRRTARAHWRLGSIASARDRSATSSA